MLIHPSIAGDTCGSARIGAQYRSKCSAFARFLVICQNRGAIPNMPYDAMVELPAYIGKNGPEVISRDNIQLFQLCGTHKRTVDIIHILPQSVRQFFCLTGKP